jgi:predicted RNase H-like HicB family nuclease
MRAKIKVKGLKFIVPLIIEPDTISFHVYSPALKGLHVDGDTEEEALKIGREAVKLHLESMIEDGDPIPKWG